MDSVIPRSFIRGGKNAPEPKRRSGTIAAGAVETLLDVTIPIEVDHLDFGSNSRSAVVLISVRNANLTVFSRRAIFDGGAGVTTSNSLLRISQGGTSIFRITEWHRVLARFNAGLTQALKMPHGGSISVHNPTGAAITLAAEIYYREL